MVLKVLFFLSYASVFWYVCYKRPIIALAFSFAFSPLSMSVVGDSVNASLSDLNVVLCLPLLLFTKRQAGNKLDIGPLTAPVIVYLIVCLISSAVASEWRAATTTWLQMALYFGLTVYVFANLCKAKELALIPYYTVGIGVFWALIGLSTNFRFLIIGKNSFGASLASILMLIYSLYVSWHYKPIQSKIRSEGKYLIMAGILVFLALLLTVSRGAIIGAFVGVVVMSIYTRSLNILLRAGSVVLPVLIVAWFMMPPKLKAYALDFDTSAYNIGARLNSVQIAQKLFYQDPIWGAGLGLRKGFDATNIIWSTLAETGIVGLLALTSVFAAFYCWTWKLRKVIKPQDPYFIFISMGVGLMTSRLMHGMVDHYWSRGVITMAWASVGMILCLSRVYASKSAQASPSSIEQPMRPGKLFRSRTRRVRSRRTIPRRSALPRNP